MNRHRTYGPAALGILGLLASGLLAAGCGSVSSNAGSGGALVPAVDNQAHAARTSRLPASADSGLAGCTAVLAMHQVPAGGYAKVRAQFADSRWADLGAAGTAYVDLAAALPHARADAYQTVWFYQRLLSACVRHGWENSGR
jgi:hypothetical protein